jgi:hypothetical protein
VSEAEYGALPPSSACADRADNAARKQCGNHEQRRKTDWPFYKRENEDQSARDANANQIPGQEAACGSEAQ